MKLHAEVGGRLALAALLALPSLPLQRAEAQWAATVRADSTNGLSARALLDGYVTEGLKANLAITGARSSARRAELGVNEARGRLLPSVGLNARYSEYSGIVNIGEFINPAYSALNGLLGEARFPTDIRATLPQRQETRLELVQPLFAPALLAGRSVAEAQRDIAGSAAGSAARRLAADIQLAWLGYASSERLVEILENAVVVLDENVRVSERLVGAGSATPDVVLRARAERSDVLQSLADARRQRNSTRRVFNSLRDRDGEDAVTLAADSTLQPPDTLRIERLEAHAIANREELQGASAGVRLSAAARKAAGSTFLPTVAFSASYGVQGERYRFDRRNDVALASLVLNWNLFNGGQDVARRQQADLVRNEAALRRRDAERAVQADVRNAFDAVAASRAALAAASDRLASAKRAFTLVERRYGEGLATQIEYLSARSAFTSAALNETVTRYGLAARAVDLERAAATRVLPE